MLWNSTYQGLVPLVDMEGAGTKARVLAGDMEIIGRFKTVQIIQMIDFESQANSTISFDIGQGLDMVMLLYIYESALESLKGAAVERKSKPPELSS
jgi:hypothetical protein